MSDLFLNLVLVISLSSAKAEYPCVCNYNVEQSVLPYASAQAQPIGYVYEFDCKPTYPLTNLDKENWYSIIYNGQVAYLQKNSNAEEMECAGQPVPEDRITTKIFPTSLAYSTTPATKVSEKVSTNTTRHLNTTHINGLFSYPTNIGPQRTTESHALSSSYSTTMATETSVKTSALPDSTKSQTEKMTSSVTNKNDTQTFVTLKITGGSFSAQAPGAMTPIQSSSTQTIYASSVANTTGHSSSAQTVNRSMESTSTRLASAENSLQTTFALTPRPTPPSSIGDILLCGQKLYQYTREDEGALTQYGSKCYELVPFELIWTKAELDCQAKGGHLLTVLTSYLQDYIYNWVKRFSRIPAVWLGLSDKQQDGIYQWISGEHIRTTFWYTGSSRSHRNDSADCGLMVFSPPYFGQWEAVGCGETTPTGDRGSQNAFICEFSIESQIMSGQIIGK